MRSAVRAGPWDGSVRGMGILSVLRWNNVQTVGALNESALYVARAEDPAAAREQCVAILDRILYGLMAGS